MGRYRGAVCRLCRREGTKLFLKGSRCYTKLCAIEKRNTTPGMHTWRRGKLSEYGQRLREKQKVKRYYGIYETQFKNYYYQAAQKKGDTGENLLQLLERRLDNVLYRSHFAISRKQGRQIINHGHVRVNGRKVDIASYLVNEGDKIEALDKEKSKKIIADNLEKSSSSKKDVPVPSWLEVSQDPVLIQITQFPSRDEIQIDIQEQLIIEFCSR